MVSPLPTPPSAAQPHYPPKIIPFLSFLLENKGATKINKNETNKEKKRDPKKTIRNTYKYRETCSHTPRNPL